MIQMSQLVDHRWFALAEFSITITCGFVLFFSPNIGGWIVLIAFVPLLIRVLTSHVEIGETYSIILLAIFLTAVGFGIWAAYDRQGAWDKFWILLTAVALFYTLINQPRENFRTVAGLIGLLGVIITVTFIATNDWHTQSSDFELISRAGEWISSHSQFNFELSLAPNIAGGLLAMIVPIPIALTIAGWQRRDLSLITSGLLMVMVILLGLLLTSSRGAWLALIAGILLWIMWKFSLLLSKTISWTPRTVFLVFMVIILLPLSFFVFRYPGGFVSLANSLPGMESGSSRFELAENTLKLVQDFPFTGGGLRSFPGLYSQYIMVTPFFLFAYSHNFYLDLVLEVGWIGALGLLMIFLISLARLMQLVGSSRENPLHMLLSEAVLIGFIIVLLHGFVDDALFADKGSPLLLLLPGLAFLLTNQISRKSSDSEESNLKVKSSILFFKRRRLILPASLLLVLILISLFFRNVFVSSLYANLGAVLIAKSELKDWPTNSWNIGVLDPDYKLAEELFVKSSAFDKDQRTAWHRLGLIAMQNLDYQRAENYLERAYNIDPEHRGIRKSLGYTYVWMGKYERAAKVLKDIDEAKSELNTYSWWWREQGREDLALQAKEMAGMLSGLGGNINQEGDS